MSIVDEEKRSKLRGLLAGMEDYYGCHSEPNMTEYLKAIETLMLAPNTGCDICAKSDVCATLSSLSSITFPFRIGKLKEEFDHSPFWSGTKEALGRSCDSFLREEKTDES